MMKTGLFNWLFAALFLVLAGCESADDTPDTTPSPKPAINAISYDFGSQANRVPIIGIQVAKGTQITFTVSTTVPAGRTIAQYDWTFPLGVTAGDINPDSGSVAVTFNEVGEFVIGLVVVDSSGASSAPAQVSISVIDNNGANSPPTVAILHDNGQGGELTFTATQIAVSLGDKVRFKALVSDPNGDAVNATVWDFGSLTATISDTTNQIYDVVFGQTGNFSIKASATDANNATGNSPIITIVVTDPTVGLPDSAITHNVGNNNGANVSVDRGDTVTFNAQPTGTGYSYVWSFDGGVVVSGDVSGAGPIAVKFDSVKDYTVSLTVSNSNGADQTPATVKVSAIDPNATIQYKINNGTLASSGNPSVKRGDTVSFQASPNNPNYTYEWTFGGAANNATGAGPINVTFDQTGDFTVTLKAINANGFADPTPASLVVSVSEPTLPDANITYLVGGTGSPASGDFQVNIHTSVIFGVALPVNQSYTYEWNFSGAANNVTGQDATVTFNQAGTFVVTLTASATAADGSTLTDPTPATVTVTVIAPTFNIVHDNGSGDGNVTRTTDIINISTGASVVYNFSSDFGNSSNYDFSWDFDGPGYTTDSATGNLKVTYDGSWVTPNTTNGAGTYKSTLQVIDKLNTANVTLIQVTVNVTATNNLPPTATITHDLGGGVAGSSGDVTIAAGSTIAFVGTGTDPEGTNVSYSWDLPGAAPASATTKNVSATYATPGNFTATLFVRDATNLLDLNPPTVNVTVMPAFQLLPVLAPTSRSGANVTYTISVDENVAVKVVTPTETWNTPMLRYNQLQLPPVISVERDDNVTVNVTNKMANDETTIHWHGLMVDGANDGGPDFPIAGNGGTLTYQFTVQQPAAPLWFHPHPDMLTGTQVYRGLAGAFIVNDTLSRELENSQQLPSGDHDIAMLLQDRQFDATTTNGVRNLIYQNTMPGGFVGMLGDRILVNGAQSPALHVDTRKYLFRLYNGSNARSYNLALSDDSSFMVVGSDGGLLPTPVSATSLMLAPGERAELVIDFSTRASGDSLMLVSKTFSNGMMGMGGATLANGAAFNIMSFEVKQSNDDPVTLYSALPAGAEINDRYALIPATATQPANYVDRSFVMSIIGGAMGVAPQFVINDVSYDPSVINLPIDLNANGNNPLEVWSITNSGSTMMMSMAHPFHAHAIQWQVLDRKNSAGNTIAPQPTDSGWKDTVLVQPNETVRIVGRFDPNINVGTYMYHCHILEHEDKGMMGVFKLTIVP